VFVGNFGYSTMLFNFRNELELPPSILLHLVYPVSCSFTLILILVKRFSIFYGIMWYYWS